MYHILYSRCIKKYFEFLSRQIIEFLNITFFIGHTFVSDIIFPQDDEGSSDEFDFRIADPPKCANSKIYCENSNLYPFDKIRSFVESRKYTEFWGKDQEIDVLEREELEDKFVCSTYQRIIFPTVYKNIHNKWKYIVNQRNGNFKQGILIDICKS